MRSLYRITGFQLLLLFVLAYYLVACLGVDLCHTHEPDAEFHDNCPACQWQAMYQDDFSNANRVLEVLDDPLRMIGFNPCTQSLIILPDNYRFSYLSRAPPLAA
jgi:hypothetical protein